jgi:hypothetical protein
MPDVGVKETAKSGMNFAKYYLIIAGRHKW